MKKNPALQDSFCVVCPAAHRLLLITEQKTNIFYKNEETCFDEEAMKLVREGINPISFPGLHLTITSEESKEINFDNVPKVII